jgi:hypothetical protein
MSRLYYLLLLLFLTVPSIKGMGQADTCRWIMVISEDDFLLDSLSVLKESISVTDSLGVAYTYQYDLSTGRISILVPSKGNAVNLKVCYKTFPYSFHQGLAKRTLLADYDSMAMFKDRRVKAVPVFDFREELFPATNLNKSGNLTRGISFGNSQNLFVNSSLNLQMSGQLAENLNIRASITDQNVPFQPEGNTQQLQDFDNVLVELYNDRFNLSAGDVVLQQRQSEFLRYYKNVQGLQFTTNYKLGEKWKASSQGAASIAKGKFASIVLPVTEGTLGPYQIPGPQNERFIIIMANSERVFLDGRLLQRGFNFDYVIDYNQGEITFSPNVLITQYTRIRIDYEYAERNFSRSILAANHLQENGKLSLYLNYYKEEDNRNRPLFFEFSDADKQLLASVGDDLNAAGVLRIDSVAFDAGRVLYERVIDTDALGNTLVFFRYATDPQVAFYSISFSEVGNGNGDYVRDRQLANGPVYRFVPPIDGVRQGNYSLSAPLPAPNKKQMFTAGSRLKINSYEQVYTEIAFSQVDQNLFSPLDNEDNSGYAIKSGILSEKRKFKGGYIFRGMAELEYNSAHFSFIDRLRYIEFDRDWSLEPQDLASPGHERLINAQIEGVKDVDNQFLYRVNLRNRGEILTGTQQVGRWYSQLGDRFFVRNDVFLLKSDVRQIRSDWVRYTGDIRYKSKYVVPGYRLTIDRNELFQVEKDSVVGTAMNFLEHQFFLNSNDTLQYGFFINAAVRADDFPIDGVMVKDTEAKQASLGFKRRFKAHDFNGTFTYRQLDFVRLGIGSETTVLGKIDYSGSLAKGNVRNELSYALGNGREFRREYVFLPVPTGEGTHAWRDDNSDGIQQLNEFYLAINPDEKNFIKIFVPNREFVQAYSTIFNYRLNAKFPEDWKTSTDIKKLLQKFSNTTSLSIEKKVTADDFVNRINPFVGAVAPEDLLSARQVIRSSFFFNRSSAKYGFDLSLFDSQNKQLLAGGFENLEQKEWRLNTRYNINTSWNFRVQLQKGTRISASDFLDNRNYQISQQLVGPEIAYQPSSIFRTTSSYQYTTRANTANQEFDERAFLHQLGLDFRYAKAIKTTLNANFRYIYINYNGQSNSPVGYEMLQALSRGNNLTWSLNWLQKIGEGLQMNMVYEGRNSENLGRLIHIGRMQVTALF